MAVEEKQKRSKRKHGKKNKVSFDEEIITKKNAEELLLEQSTLNQDFTNISDCAIEIKKERKKKKRKVEELDTEIKRKKERKLNDLSENAVHTESEEKIIPNGEGEKKESIRSQKRKKHTKLLEEKKLKVELQFQQKALNYLSKWKHSRSEWKFEKLRQIWLQKNMFDMSKIPSEFWETTVEYFTGAKGRCRQEVLDEALKIVEKEENTEDEVSEEFQTQLKRARNIIQILQ